MLPVREIEDFVKGEARNVELLTHNFGHFRRVALGAVWFVRVLGGKKEEQDLAYIAGLLHDIVRPATEKVCHAKASAEKSGEILKGFRVPEEAIERIVQAIRDHRLAPEKWVSPLHQSIYLADKILEQMGAYVDFRRSMYVAECSDYRNVPFEEAIEKHVRMRIEKIPKTEFPGRFSGLVEYQWKWLEDFTEAVRRGEEWALRLAKHCYSMIRERKGIEEIIRSFEPQGQKDSKTKEEALKYIEGKLFKKFGELVWARKRLLIL